jgi:hypothetical protein
MKKAESTEKSWVEQAVENARCQIGLEIDTIEASGKVLNPVTLNENEQVYYCGFSDWRSGFFPGSVWYLYELTDDNTLLSVAQKAETPDCGRIGMYGRTSEKRTD